MKTVLIAGGSGEIGKYLSKVLLEKGFKVSLLSRRRRLLDKISTFTWNVEKGEIDERAIKSADYIINLTGANIGEKRWSSKRKNEILDSRVESTKLLFKKVQELNKQLDAFITASAVGYYGLNTSDEIFTEDNIPSNDFLGIVCDKWEKASHLFKEFGIRTVQIRTGVVLNNGAGALSKMMVPIKMFIGSPLGSGNQYVPWIHIKDLCNTYVKSIEDSRMKGAYNAVAPEHITNKKLTVEIAKQLHRPLFLPNIPQIGLKILMGEMSKIALEGSRVSSEKLTNVEYKFMFPKLDSALEDLLGG